MTIRIQQLAAVPRHRHPVCGGGREQIRPDGLTGRPGQIGVKEARAALSPQQHDTQPMQGGHVAAVEGHGLDGDGHGGFAYPDAVTGPQTPAATGGAAHRREYSAEWQ